MRTISRLVCPRMLCSVYMSTPFSRYRVAKSCGANVLKQWDATLDGRTRPSHARIDGEIRETDEEYSNGLMFPGDPSGPAAEVINCRCVSKTRARWALDADELQKLQDRAAYFGLDKTENFAEFKEKYLAGEIEFEEIDDYIEIWNNSDDERTLAKFLGLSAEEEDVWIDDSDEALREMLDRQK